LALDEKKRATLTSKGVVSNKDNKKKKIGKGAGWARESTEVGRDRARRGECAGSIG